MRTAYWYQRSTNLQICLLAQLAAFWSVWRWYLARMSDGSDEPWGIAALLVALVFTLSRKTNSPGSELPSAAFVPLALYALCYPALPALARAALAVCALALTLSPLCFGRRLHLGLLGLLLLSLPLIASLQFYAGYPLRVLTGEVVTQLLALCGERVTLRGTSLLWRGDLISIDAPCSGIKMLWGALFFCFSTACFLNLDNRRTWILYVASSVTIFCANVIRTFVLFFSESRIIQAPQWFHGFAGIFAFTLGMIVISIVAQRLGRATCAS